MPIHHTESSGIFGVQDCTLININDCLEMFVHSLVSIDCAISCQERKHLQETGTARKHILLWYYEIVCE